MIHKLISRSGNYGSFTLKGKNRDLDLGVMVNINEGERVFIDTIDTTGMFVPFTFVGGGELVINTLIGFDYGGDLCDLWGSPESSVVIHNLYGAGDNPTRPYEKYHPDILQIENLGRSWTPNLDGSGNIRIPSIDVTTTGESSAGITMTGRGRNTNIHLGYEKFHMKLANDELTAVNTYSMDNCTLGGEDVKCDNKVLLSSRGRTKHTNFNNRVVGLDYLR